MTTKTKNSLKAMQKRLKSILKNNQSYDFPMAEIEDAVDDLQRAIDTKTA